jgi:hypothetical protein
MRPLQSVLRYLAEMLLEKSTACNNVCFLDRLLHYAGLVLLSVPFSCGSHFLRNTQTVRAKLC